MSMPPRANRFGGVTKQREVFCVCVHATQHVQKAADLAAQKAACPSKTRVFGRALLACGEKGMGAGVQGPLCSAVLSRLGLWPSANWPIFSPSASPLPAYLQGLEVTAPTPHAPRQQCPFAHDRFSLPLASFAAPFTPSLWGLLFPRLACSCSTAAVQLPLSPGPTAPHSTFPV